MLYAAGQCPKCLTIAWFGTPQCLTFFGFLVYFCEIAAAKKFRGFACEGGSISFLGCSLNPKVRV